MEPNSATQELLRIHQAYESIPPPKWQNLDLAQCESLYQDLLQLKAEAGESPLYRRLAAALSQILEKQRRLAVGEDAEWRNTPERGINKAILPLVRKPGKPVEDPFEGQDLSSGYRCSISNGHWEARNFMVMDVLAYCYLLKEGKDRLPGLEGFLFPDTESILRREHEHGPERGLGIEHSGEQPLARSEIERIKASPHWISFDDKKFREFTGLPLESSEILKLLHDTSRVEFKLTYPVRLKDERNTHRERIHTMNRFSRLFEFGYIDEDVRNGAESVYMRRYYVSFNTLLGELFSHNLMAQNYDWVERKLYALPPSAQLFFRKCLVHNNSDTLDFNLETISQRCNLTDPHMANRVKNIIANTLEPLKREGFIKWYRQLKGLSGTKFRVNRKFPPKRDSKNAVREP